MNGSSAFEGVACEACGAEPADPAVVTACLDCGGPLRTHYDHDALASADLTLADLLPATDQYRFVPFLPFDREVAVTLGEGGTPLVDCPALADDAGVGRLLVKDEGVNPTGSIADRGASLAVTAAVETGAQTVTLPSTGHGGRAIAAYAARAGLDSTVFVPARAPFDCKAMINVHGGEMTVAGGKYADAEAAFEESRDHAWADLGPGSAYRQDGATSCYGEILEALEWTVPDAVVVPTGHGTTVTGLYAAAGRFREAGLVTGVPAIVVAQPAGCAPVVDAVHQAGTVERVADPDTIAGALEIPDPVLGDRAAEAVRETEGSALVATDDDALAAAVEANESAGVEVGVAGGVGLAVVPELASGLTPNHGEDATVVVVNPTAGGTESDLLRSHLMGQGI